MPTDGKKTKVAKVTKVRVKRRHKHCPICDEIVPMNVTHQAKNDEDLWWLFCSACESNFALTHQEYQKEKKPNISAIVKSDARAYKTEQIYSIGELLYHSKLDDIGIVMKKSSLAVANCSGSVIVSFMKSGQRTLIEGYATV